MVPICRLGCPGLFLENLSSHKIFLFFPAAIHTLTAQPAGEGHIGGISGQEETMGRRAILGVLAFSLLWSADSDAREVYWFGDNNGNWSHLVSNNTNWSLRIDANQNTNLLPGSADTVNFCTSAATNRTVTVGGNQTIDHLVFNSNANTPFTLKGNSGSSTITLNPAAGTGLIVESSTVKHTISAKLTLGSDQSFEIQTPSAPGTNNLLISGQISGSGRHLTKTGGGLLELTGGSNDYSGGTTISGGLLKINNPVNTSATGAGSVLVDTQGSLGGNGYLSGAVDVKGTITPGNSIGTLHTGSQTWNSGGSYQFEINAPTGTPGSNWDLLDITGTLDLSSAAGFSIDLLSVDNSGQPAALSGFDNNLAQSWKIAQTQGITNFTPGLLQVDTSGFSNDLGGGLFSTSLSGNDLLLNFTPASALPEPSGLLLLAFGIVCLGRRRI